MTLAVMGIGLAGAGKSTALKLLAELHNLVYVSRDEIAHVHWGHPHDQEHRTEVGEEADARTMRALSEGRPVVLDSTFVDLHKRRHKISFLQHHGATRVIGIFFDTQFSIAVHRNLLRRFIVPREVLEAQYDALTRNPPSVNDGFDHLYRSTEIDEMRQREFILAN